MGHPAPHLAPNRYSAVDLDGTTTPALLVLASDIADRELLLYALPAHVRVLRDGISTTLEHIRCALTTIRLETGRLAALHLVGHGAPGEITIDDLHLDAESLDHVASALRTVPLSLIALHGCHTGADLAGESLVTRLRSSLGVPVHASCDFVGRAPDGEGCWELDGLSADKLPFAQAAMDVYPHHFAG